MGWGGGGEGGGGSGGQAHTRREKYPAPGLFVSGLSDNGLS